MNNQDQNATGPIPVPTNHEHSVFVLLNAQNEIRHLRHRVQILSAKEQVLNIFAAALGGNRNYGGECATVDVLGEIEAEIQRHRAAAEYEKQQIAKDFCDHRRITLAEDPTTATCQDCGAECFYDSVTHNFTPVPQVASYPNPTNPANIPGDHKAYEPL